MNQYIATVIDTTGIQSYIFGSNRLRENIGASYLVEQVTNDWVGNILRANFCNNIYINELDGEKCIENDDLDAELVYTGGGNAVILFKDKNSAVDFTRKLSKKSLIEAPNLKIVVAHSEPFSFGKNLSNIIDELMKELERKKHEYHSSTPILGLGITASCLSTGLPAVNTSDQYGVLSSYPISREIVAKLQAVDTTKQDPANRKLKETIFDDLELGDYEIPYDVDDLGRTEGKSSYIAIVHVDGNGMGDRFKDYGKTCQTDREYITAMRELSKSVNEAGINALKAVVKKVIQLVNGELQEKFSITEKDGKKYLPFRPIVYGGDDVTFVCDGRLGLTLAALYLKEFESQPIADNKDLTKKLTACAGIAIVKTHYPFSRAYQLSESLCKKAKKFMYDEKTRLECLDFSAMDWHIAASGLSGSIGEIRKREYQVAEGNLSMRPISLYSQNDWRNWEDFSEIVNSFRTHSHGIGGHNKVMALREHLRQGSRKTQQFLQIYYLDDHDLPKYPLSKSKNEELYQSCWIYDPRNQQRICGYFDAIEAMEFYFPLKEKANEDLPAENITVE